VLPFIHLNVCICCAAPIHIDCDAAVAAACHHWPGQLRQALCERSICSSIAAAAGTLPLLRKECLGLRN
jgi:hypothetical protein